MIPAMSEQLPTRPSTVFLWLLPLMVMQHKAVFFLSCLGSAFLDALALASRILAPFMQTVHMWDVQLLKSIFSKLRYDITFYPILQY